MKYESEFLKIIHQDAIEMFRIGVITEARMREYDEMCLPNSKKEASSSPTQPPTSPLLRRIIRRKG